jgi:hypothetical protein
VVIITAGMYLLARLSDGPNGLYLLAWSLLVCTILVPFKKILSGKESKEPPQMQQVSRRVSKPQEIKATSQLTTKASTFHIDEIPSKSVKAETQETSDI